MEPRRQWNIRRWRPCAEDAQSLAELWAAAPQDVPQANRMGEECYMHWDVPNLPVCAGERYVIILSHHSGDSAIRFGFADNRFSECTQIPGSPVGPGASPGERHAHTRTMRRRVSTV